jgi:hypothetical protein
MASLATQVVDEQCTLLDHYNSVVYEHKVIAQAAAEGAGPDGTAALWDYLPVTYNNPTAAPPWFQGALARLRADLQNDPHEIRDQVEEVRDQLRGQANRVRGQVTRLRADVPRILPDGRDPNQEPVSRPGPIYCTRSGIQRDP